MLLPSIALPTGAYDWHPERTPRAVFEARLADLRAAMARRGATHAVVHGNGFDHGALAWLTHFTPKLGPAYALVPLQGQVRLLFSGGPGMKPSAQRLTWVEELAALRAIEPDVTRWLAEAAPTAGGAARLGLVEGEAMLQGDWRAIARAAGGQVIALDADFDAARARKTPAEIALIGGAAAILGTAAEHLWAARPDADLAAAVIGMERAAYRAGAQDVRVRIGATEWGRPAGLTEVRRGPTGPAAVALSVRHAGYWAHGRFRIGPVPAETAAAAGRALSACLAALQAGASAAGIADAAGRAARISLHGLGLSPAEALGLSPARGAGGGTLETPCALSVVAELPVPGPEAGDATAVWSMAAAMEGGSARLLWSPPGIAIGPA